MVWPFSKKTNSPERPVPLNVEKLPDGSVVMTTEYRVTGNSRPVRQDVVAAMDEALKAIGGEVLHAIDPRRSVPYAEGGPALWSTGVVKVAGNEAYTLILSYGMSAVVSPEDARTGIGYEYSIAVPARVSFSPWADAILRHLARYVLTSGKELSLGQVLPCYLSITKMPFAPEQQAAIRDSPLVGILVAADPVLPFIQTPRGALQVRRLVGIHQDELDRCETWSAESFAEEYAREAPLLLTDPDRPSAMRKQEFADRVNERAADEGSEMPAILVDVAWGMEGKHLVIDLPGGREAQKILDAIHGRLAFGKDLALISRESPPIHFLAGERFGFDIQPDGLYFEGNPDVPELQQIILRNIRPDVPQTTLRIPIGERVS